MTQQVSLPQPVPSSMTTERARGGILAAAVGDALGAPYEFQSPIPDSEDVEMIGGGVLEWEPGEWTDDTAMSIILLEALEAGADAGLDFRSEAVLDDVASGWFSWSMSTPDIGALTSTVMRRAAEIAQARSRTAPLARDFRDAATRAGEELPQIAGNGALMRVHVIALAHCAEDEEDLAEVIGAVVGLSHVHEDVLDACLLWGIAVRHAVLTGEIDVRRGLPLLPTEREQLWAERIEQAEESPPAVFGRTGWVVHAFQAAWSAIHQGLPIPEDRFARRALLVGALESSVRAGYDTDTVACIAGALLGSALGEKAIPPEWRRVLHGWPGADADELMDLAGRALAPGIASIGRRTP